LQAIFFVRSEKTFKKRQKQTAGSGSPKTNNRLFAAASVSSDTQRNALFSFEKPESKKAAFFYILSHLSEICKKKILVFCLSRIFLPGGRRGRRNFPVLRVF
jgi:hypothetical protein